MTQWIGRPVYDGDSQIGGPDTRISLLMDRMLTSRVGRNRLTPEKARLHLQVITQTIIVCVIFRTGENLCQTDFPRSHGQRG